MKNPRVLDVALLATLLLLKLNVNFRDVDWGFDGNYYANIAKHIRDGHGFVTDISMYHEGFPSFPQQTPVYPVWPLLLGWVSKLIPMEVTAVWLPTVFFFGAMGFGMRLADRLHQRSLLPELLPALRFRHLFVLGFGFNPELFLATSRPYTEGLGWMCMLAALLRFERLFRAGGVLRGFEAGLIMALLMCIRSQFVVVAAAVFATLAGAAVLVSPRGQWVRATLAFLPGMALGFAPLLAWYSTFIPEPSLTPLLRFEQWQPEPRLSQISLFWPTEGVVGWLLDRAGGFLVAFDERGRYSYSRNFGSLMACLPVALVAWIASVRAGELRRAWGWLCSSDNGFRVFLGVFALAQFLFIHSIHKAEFSEWNFGMRHAVGVGFIFVACTAYLLARGGVWRLFACYAIAASLHINIGEIQELGGTIGFDRGYATRRAALDPWLRGHQATDPDLRILVPEPQRYSQFLSGVGLHCAHDFTTCEDIVILLGELDTDFWMAPVDDRTTACERAPVQLDAWFTAIPGSPPGWHAYVLKED